MAEFSYQSACNWVNNVEKIVPDSFRSYFDIHKIRYMNTFQFHSEIIGSANIDSVLDLGGSGLFTSLAHQAFSTSKLTVSGFTQDDRDLDSADNLTFLDQYQKKHELITFDFDNPPSNAADNSYDLIYCLEVIEHIAIDPAAFLRELLRILKPDGLLMLSTPNITSTASLERLLNYQSPIGYPYFRTFRSSDRHNIEYTPNQLRHLIENSGYSIDKMTTVNSWTSPSLAMQNFMYHNGISSDMRGDNIFVLATPSGLEPVEFPPEIYK